MTIFKPTSVSEQPVVTMTHWSFRIATDEDGFKTKHLVGVVDEVGRVSSPVKEILDNGDVVTESGRIYKLIGSCGRHKYSEYIWDAWLSYYDCSEVVND